MFTNNIKVKLDNDPSIKSYCLHDSAIKFIFVFDSIIFNSVILSVNV